MRETTKAIQELAIFFKGYWYFSLIYIWWIATTVLYFKEKEPWEKEELPFNWFAYLIIVGVLFGLFFWNRGALNAFFEGLWHILLFIIKLLDEVSMQILLAIEPQQGQPVLVQIILYVIILVIAIWILIILFWGAIIALIGGAIIGVLYVIWWLLNDLTKKWFGGFEFKYKHSIPLLALIFYPATDFTFNFLIESLTRHPLEGALTVKASRKTWFLIIGLLILLTGIIGKIIG